MRINKNSSFFISILLIQALTIFGCAKQADEVKPDESKKKVKVSDELVIWLVGSESQAQAINLLSEDFSKLTGIKVRCEAISWGDAHSKYLTSIAGGVTPDIGTMGLTWGTEFGNLGAMVDLAEEFPEDIEKIKNKTFASIWQAAEYKEKVFGVPFDLSENILYYRKDIIRRPPKSWDELTNLLLKLKREDKGMIFDWGSMNWIGYSIYLWQAGGDYFNSDGTKVILDSPEGVEALRFFADLYTKYGVPKTKIPIEQGMRTGDFPLAISGNWKIDGLRLGAPEIAGKWAIALLPAGPTGKHTAFIGGRVMGIFTQSKHKQEAWAFIKFLFSDDIQVKLFEAARAAQDSYLPTNIAAWGGLPLEPQFKSILKQQAQDAQGPPSVLGWDDATRFVDEAIQRVILEGKSPKDELLKAAKVMQRNIK